MNATATKKTSKTQPRGLGKGLSALMSESYSQTLDATTAQESPEPAAGPKQTLPLDRIRSGKYQPRDYFDEAALVELADSIGRNGVMQPILVRGIAGGDYEIIAGERRWRAARIAGLSEIPVLIRDIGDEQALELALVENVQRQDLHPLEEATGYQRLMDEFSYTQEALARTVHKSRSHIANLLRLITLPPEVRRLFTENQISMGHARALIGSEDIVALAQEVARRGLSVRQTEELIRKRKDPAGERAPRQRPQPAQGNAIVSSATSFQRDEPNKDPDILALEETLSENLGLKVSINDHGQSGEIRILYESLEQLDEILRRLGGSI